MKPYPRLRPDLTASEYRESDGTETVILKEPVSEKFFRLSLYEYEMLRMLDGTVSVEQAVQRLKTQGMYYTAQEANTIVTRAAQFGLLLGTHVHTARNMMGVKERMEKAKSSQRLSSYYFFSLPLWNPDSFLDRTVWLFRLLCNKWTAGLLAIAVPIALYLIVAGFPRLQREYLFFFNWQNLLCLWAMIVLTKLVHEFSHAYTAKSFGLHVPQMGVALLLFFPCLFCNTTDAWQLADRRQRMAISAAGIVAETVLAVMATFVWFFSKPGIMNSLAFYLMTISLVSTFLFNANPLIKFDGYFILMDYLQIPNLATKAMDHIKYLFMNRVLGITDQTSPASGPRELSVFTVYGIAAFLYRISLYLGIAAGVYYRFDKLLGILLAVPALAVFVVKPVVRGLFTLVQRRQEIRPRLGGVAVFAGFGLVLATLFLFSWPVNSVYRCYVASVNVQKITVPLPLPVKEVFVREGSRVHQGDVLFTLDTRFLELSLHDKMVDKDIISAEIESLMLSHDKRAQADSKRIELLKAADDIARIREKLALAEHGFRAPFDGTVTSLDYRMQDGFKPGEGAVVGEMEDPRERFIHALIPEEDLGRVHQGQTVTIRLPIGYGQTLRLPVESIKPYSETNLLDSPFSSRFGGEVATEIKGEHEMDAPLRAYYTCSVRIQQGDDLPSGLTGQMIIPAPPKSLVSKMVDSLMETFNRESLL
jgi:putative peptide zinc metalloprotease protein